MSTDPFDLDRAGLRRLVEELGEPAYRARQLLSWLARGVDRAERMTDLPKATRAALEERFAPTRPELLRHSVADGGTTHKLLLALPGPPDAQEGGGTFIETVLMLYPPHGEAPARATVCVSSQAGCAMACTFCATGQAGLQRQLTGGEIVRQVILAQGLLGELAALDSRFPRRVTNLVYMGMGEPLANLDATEASLRWLTDPEGFGLSARAITVSTVGLVPGIRRMARLGLPLRMAVSLHAPDDDLRDRLVPVNRLHPLADLLRAVRDYQAETRRRVSFEYVLIGGVNDARDQALALARLVRPTRGHVNLIPLNPTPGMPEWHEPSPRQVRGFLETLTAHGVNATVRDTRGREADAACGQLLATYRLGQGRRLPLAARLQPGGATQPHTEPAAASAARR